MKKITNPNKLEEGKTYLWIKKDSKLEWIWFIYEIDWNGKEVTNSLLIGFSSKSQIKSNPTFSFNQIEINLCGENNLFGDSDKQSGEWNFYLLNEKEIEPYKNKIMLNQL